MHLGPVAGDALADIPGAYASPLAGILAVAAIVAFIVLLAFTAVYEARLALRKRSS